MMPCGALLVIAIINNGNDTKHLILDFLVSFLRFGCGDAFCSDTFLQTDEVTHRSLYKQTRYSYTERFAHKKSIHTPLQTEVFTQRRKYLHTDASHRDAFVRKRRIGIFTHRTFYTEKPLHRIVFTHVFSTPQTFDKEKLLHTDCTQKFLRRRMFFAQALSHKKKLHHNFYR